MIDLCSTNELVYELGLTFTRPRNLTFDRFQLITVQKNANENLETFFSRLRELGSKFALGNVEEDLIKNFFITKMNNRTIQMELLSEVRTAAQVLNFALSIEQGQENQREILRSSTTNWNTQLSAISNNHPRNNVRQQQPAQKTKTNKKICSSCAGIFTPGHITQCTAKQAQCSICKRHGILEKMCCSKIPPLPQRKNQPREGYQRPQGPAQSQLRVPTQESLIAEGQIDQAEEESVDPETALYIRELTDYWADVNHITPKAFNPIKNTTLNKLHPEEI